MRKITDDSSDDEENIYFYNTDSDKTAQSRT